MDSITSLQDSKNDQRDSKSIKCSGFKFRIGFQFRIFMAVYYRQRQIFESEILKLRLLHRPLFRVKNCQM